MNVLPHTLCRALAAAALVTAALLTGTPPEAAAMTAKPHATLQRTVTVTAVGDGQVELRIQLPEDQYGWIKYSDADGAYLRRQFCPPSSWQEVKDFHATFEDATHTVKLQWTVRGLAHLNKNHRWEVSGDVFQMAGQPQIHDHRVSMAAPLHKQQFSPTCDSLDTEMHSDLVIPADAQDLKLVGSPLRVEFQQPAQEMDRGDANVDVRLQAKHQLIPALAALYGSPNRSDMWLGRFVLENNGGQGIKHFRVRFRLGDLTRPEWTVWKSYDLVLPGQTVVEPYYPVLDLDKLASRTYPYPVELEAEYEYEQADGQMVHESMTRRLQVLGSRQIVFTDRTRQQIQTWADAFNYSDALLTAYITGNDPVIQQVAGWICREAGGVPSAISDVGALQYMQLLWEFLAANRISYQTPPGGELNGLPWQDVRFARDTLKNNGGTCIDLAILYATFCDTMGLQPVLYLVPGHCFPAVRLPQSGRIVAVEATMLPQNDFNMAVEVGMREVALVKKESRFAPLTGQIGALLGSKLAGPFQALPFLPLDLKGGEPIFYEVDIAVCRAAGFQSMNLPPCTETPSAWGIDRVKAKPAATGSLEGTWYASQFDAPMQFVPGTDVHDVRLVQLTALKLEVYADGTFVLTRKAADGTLSCRTGRFTLETTPVGIQKLTLTYDDGSGQPGALQGGMFVRTGEDGFRLHQEDGKFELMFTRPR